MSYLWYLLGYEIEEEEEPDDKKDRQKHLKFLCCKSIETALPKLRHVAVKNDVRFQRRFRRLTYQKK